MDLWQLQLEIAETLLPIRAENAKLLSGEIQNTQDASNPHDLKHSEVKWQMGGEVANRWCP